jgi:hypothetical protein
MVSSQASAKVALDASARGALGGASARGALEFGSDDWLDEFISQMPDDFSTDLSTRWLI